MGAGPQVREKQFKRQAGKGRWPTAPNGVSEGLLLCTCGPAPKRTINQLIINKVTDFLDYATSETRTFAPS